MGLDASVRCRCFEEGKLRPGPVPIEDLYIDDEGYLSSRKLDDAYARFSLRQVWARYYELENAFREWSDHPCEHEDGEICSERVGNWSGCAVFEDYCEEIGEERVPILAHILPSGNGGTFPAEMAEAALKELDFFDAWLDEKMCANPTGTLIDASTGEEVWSPEDGTMTILTSRIAKADIDDGEFRVVDNDHHKGEVLFASPRFLHEYIDDPLWKGDKKRYRLTCLESGASIECWEGFDFCSNDETSFTIGSRKAWCWTYANVALRNLLNASLETGNPIRWC